ncbi:MAG: hypothetical protein AM325_007290 [Candidatus Thorarchaeota archaeon SMTZ1-45]|nr:MAG: hypothetical protein AM325_09020 [Candidatus Thorarchaeota archaeon SMTZ1-45]
MSSFSDEFSVPENYTMEDIKYGVKSWNASYLGKDYIMEVISERHIVLTKAKHDMRLCFYPCIALLIGIPLLFLIMMASPFLAIFGVFLYIGIVVVVEVIAVYLFCLKPKKVEYSITFTHDMPIHVRVIATGEIGMSEHEYQGLKNSLHGGRSDPRQGLELDY